MPGIVERWRTLFKPNVYQVYLGPDAPSNVLNYTARQLYNSQDNLSAVVNFLANSIAQLPLKVYRRKGETDRERDRNSKAALLLWRPNSDQTEYEFIRAIATEYFVFGCVYVWVLPDAESESGYQLRIIPTEWVTQTDKANAYGPESITVQTHSGNQIGIPSSEFVRFCTYSPGNPGGYVSPVSALRQTLEEQIQAGRFRKELWRSSGRLNAQIIRPKDVQPWDEETKKRWITAFREAWGAGGSKAGSIPLLEDGMEIKPFSTSFKEQQWAESIKLSREAVAAAYRINPSLVWHTDTQTYASAKDNSRALYAECLGPDLQMIQQRINSFLLPMIGEDPDLYVEFDLTEKLKGSFEERAAILQAAVGGPWMTRNEARADNNLPPVDGGDDLIVPLNVVQGGQASPTDTHMDEQEPMAIEPAKACGCKSCKAVPILIKGKSDEEEDEQTAATLAAFFRRQAKSVLPKIGAGADWWDAERWNAELADDLEPVMDAIADKHGAEAAKEIGSEYGTEVTRNYLKAMASGRAAAYNAATRKKLEAVLEDDEAEEDPADVFQKREETDSGTLGRSLATAVASWAILEAAHQAENDDRIPRGRIVEKEWVTGDNPRPSHAAMDGERVPIDANFSNGAYWPGDDVLGPDETCGCNCSTEILITEV
jgi:HK97 family phage portal protein